MNGMENLTSLEWPLLLKQYSAHCLSTPAKELALEVSPVDSLAEAESLLSFTAEAMQATELGNFSSLASLNSMLPTLERLLRSQVLDGKDLLSLAQLGEVSFDCKNTLLRTEIFTKAPLLGGEAEKIPDLRKFVAPIRHAIDPDGSVKDSASPELRSLRSQERKIHAEARDKLDTVLQHAFRDGYLQDKFFDLRDGRYLIPVKSESRNRVPGFVVESSATKATVFMEPAAVRDCNDRLKQIQLQIEEEIYRILSSLSFLLHPQGEDFFSAYENVIALDLVLARGSFARHYENIRGVSRPHFSDHFALEDLYHPLLGFVLKPEKIIRNTFTLGPDKKVLVISGPNTGGKTVLLKAVGLAALMARSGFFLPCAGHATLPFFSKILAQIGDAQNLELSLSSFSGSILQMKEILESAEKDSLVLVDEILHATDPDEATALSRAILSALQARGSFAVVTTHLNGLKVGEEFAGASMEFNLEELSPTYRLRMGIPGSSRAMEIALKLGLEGSLVEKARSFLSVGRRQEQEILDRLELRERELEELKSSLAQEKAQAIQEAKRFEELNDALDEQKRMFRQQAQARIQEQERSALAELEKLSSLYKKRLSTVEEKHEAAQEGSRYIVEVKEKFRAAEIALDVVAPPVPERKAETKPVEQAAPTFQKNSPVKIPSLGTEGVLLSDPADKKRPAEVMVGNIRMRFKWEQLQPRALSVKPAAGSRPYATSSDHADVPPELHLLGKTVDEAESLLNSYLDRASRSGRPWVRIVHGHGSGALKKMVREALKRTAYELKSRPGTASEGGEGCTVVEFL